MQDENCGEKMISGVDQPQVAAEISTVTDETDADKQGRKAHIWPKSKNKFFIVIQSRFIQIMKITVLPSLFNY
jgi:hypothetical protein